MPTIDQNPLHLYRALLREASYLIHPTLKEFHINLIKSSFRRQRGRHLGKDQNEGSTNRALSLPSKRASQQMRRGRKQLYILQRANNGYMGALENVFRAAFARKGKRKRVLMREIMSPAPLDPHVHTHSSTPPKQFSPNWQPVGRFMALLRSQGKVHRFLDSRGKIKVFPTIPERNRWNRPFPRCRVKKILRSWYAKHANMITPPLAEAEWMVIRDLTLVQRWKPVPRRRTGTVPIFAEAFREQESNFAPDELVRTCAQAYSPEKSNRTRAALGNPHRLTSRYVRRIVSRSILQNTPTTLADPKTGEVAVRWEAGTNPIRPRVCTVAQNLALFG